MGDALHLDGPTIGVAECATGDIKAAGVAERERSVGPTSMQDAATQSAGRAIRQLDSGTQGVAAAGIVVNIVNYDTGDGDLLAVLQQDVARKAPMCWLSAREMPLAWRMRML